MTMDHRAAGVSSRAIELAVRGKAFQVADLQQPLANPPSRQTCYRVLRQLETDEWVERDGNTWRPGVKADLLGDVDDEPERHGRDGFSPDVSEILQK